MESLSYTPEIKEIRNIKGIQELSLVDFPGVPALVIFMGGCNMACSYCHNKILLDGSLPDISFFDVVEIINRNRRLISGIVVSGGEPTISEDIIPLLTELKSLELKVKLDTNGLRSDVIERIVYSKLVDYIAVDIKTDIPGYRGLGCIPGEEWGLTNTLKFLKSQELVTWEARTTYIPEVVTLASVKGMKNLIDGVDNYYVQATSSKNLVDSIGFCHLARASFKVKNFQTRNFKGVVL